MIKLFQFIVLLILQISFIPFAVIGIMVTFYKEMRVSKKLEVSYTAGKALQPRWLLHYFKTRADGATVRFIKVFPIELHFGLMAFMGAAIISNRICGYKPTLVKIPESGKETWLSFLRSRVIHFDQIMKKNVDQVKQVVIMGAGYDLRVLQYTKGKNVKVFELDQEKTQNLKIATMKKAGIKHDWINYIPIDFREESWARKLMENGFKKNKKTFFLWESVSLYVEEDAVKDTLKMMAEISGKGSVIAQDFYSLAFVKGEFSFTLKKSVNLMKKRGEPWKFGIEMSKDARGNVESLMKESGLALKEFVLFGEKNKNNRPFYCIAEAEKR